MDHVVIFLHGLGRTSRSMGKLKRAIELDGHHVEGFDYQSRAAGIARHAHELGEYVRSLSTERVSFVTHSLGAIVVRQLLEKRTLESQVDRVVMIAPPNQGSALARIAHNAGPLRYYLGPALSELADCKLPDPESPALCIPRGIGVIAGVRGNGSGYNPLLNGEDDGLVALSETHLPAASDHLTVRGIHTFLMNQPSTIDATLRFIREGRFSSSQVVP